MKTIFVALVALLVGSNIWWLYQTIDQAVTLSYRDQVLYEATNRVSALTTIANETLRGKSKADADAMLRRLFPDETHFEKDGALNTSWLSLNISPDGKVVGVNQDETMQHWAKPLQSPPK
ncbi:MAG: hypothetical protein HZC22_12535 [Rhodocyclales bacterium]|nr:hypothetical protein [Rhodocyclales bacterium]